MAFELTIEKSGNFIGPMGWGSVLHKKTPDKDIFLIVLKKSDGFVEGGSGSIEDYFDRNVERFDNVSENSLKEALKFFLQEVKKEHSVDKEDFYLCGLLLIGERLYLVKTGGFLVYLFREGKSVNLTVGKENTVSLSGNIKSGDGLVISTNTFFDDNTQQKLQDHLGVKEPNAYQKSISPTKNTPFLVIKIGRKSNDDTFIVNKGEYSGKFVNENRISGLEKSEKTKNNLNLKHVFASMKARALSVNRVEDEKMIKRKRSAAIVGVGLLILLAVSMVFGIKRKAERDFKESYQNDLSSAQHNLDEALDIYSLNQTRSRELFSKSRVLANDLSQRGIEDPELIELLSKINESQGRVLGEYDVSSENYVDLSLLTNDFNGDEMLFTNGYIYVTDKGSRRIVKLTLSSKRSEVVVGPNKISDINAVAAYGDRIFVFNNDGLFDVSNERQKLLDDQFGGSLLAGSFAGNLYILDSSTSQILRFSGDGQDFGSGKNWLTDSVTVNLFKARTMMIDGSIWVLGDDGEIQRFTSGNLDGFRFNTDYVGGFNIDNIFTSDESEGLYVLDKQKGKIIVFTKSGDYVAQYISEDLKNTSAFIVSEDDKKIILLGSNKLYSIELKHL